MGESEGVRGRRPQFFDERGVPESVVPPEEMVGVYTFPRNSRVADSDRTYTRLGVLTSEGWVPPTSKILVHTVSQTGSGPNDIQAVGNYTAGKATRVAIDPRELRGRLGESGEIVADRDVTPVVRSTYRGDVDYYIPEGLDEASVAEYLRECVPPAVAAWTDEHGDGQPSADAVAGILVEDYGVSEDAARRAVALAFDES